MAGLFDRPPAKPQQGLLGAIFSGMGRGLTNPGGFFVNEGGPAAQALGGMVLSPFVQANQAMPWGGNDPSAIGIDPQTGSIDPSVMVPWATDVAGTVTAGAGMAPPVMGGAGMGIRAYHGSPHDFERFSMDKIGTGEGAQAYGHGLYFAENPKVAADYRKQLAPKSGADDPIGNAWDLVNNYHQNPDELAAKFEGLSKTARDPKQGEKYAQTAEILRSRAYESYSPAGRTYEVDIDASPDEFLDWDKPLSEQPKAIQDALNEIGYFGENRSVSEGYRKLGADYGGPDQAAEKLRTAGIKGIRYLDEGSRGLPIQADQLKQTLAYWQDEADNGIKSVGGRSVADEIAKITKQLQEVKPGTSNYVVFDDKTISILKKYGLAGLTAGGAGAAMLGGGTDQAQAAQPPWMTGGRF